MGFLSLIKKLMPIVCVVVGILALSYFVFIRSRLLRLGATAEEVSLPMPGDQLVLSPNMKYMQAVTIDAPRDIVWKYLIQVGYKRGGWYNLDFINRMTAEDYFYENNKSAERIIPELQNLSEGDKIYLNPQLGMDVSMLKTNEVMLLTGSEYDKYVASWVYKLDKVDEDTTRMLVRWNSNTGSNLFLKIVNLVIMEPASSIQQAFMFKGMKRRVEKEYKRNEGLEVVENV